MARQSELVEQIVRDYLDELNYIHPRIQSEKFKETSAARWACQELLLEFRKHPEMPKFMIMENFRNRMDEYTTACMRSSMIFSYASDTVNYLMEEYWLRERRTK